MNVIEHLLACVAEECAEVQQLVGKSLRFGLDDRNVLNPPGPTNRERLIEELNDLLGVADLCVEYGILPYDWKDKAKQYGKRGRVISFMTYARSKGALSPAIGYCTADECAAPNACADSADCAASNSSTRGEQKTCVSGETANSDKV